MKKWAAIMAIGLFRMSAVAATIPLVVSSQIRANDPTVLDVVYKVMSDKQTINVRALAFEDGERSFWKVVRPETFIDGTAANIGDVNGDGRLDNADYQALRAIVKGLSREDGPL